MNVWKVRERNVWKVRERNVRMKSVQMKSKRRKCTYEREKEMYVCKVREGNVQMKSKRKKCMKVMKM